MTPEQKNEHLGKDYAEYVSERDKMAQEGKSIGTFIGWRHDNRATIKIPFSREVYFGKKADSVSTK